MPEIGKHLPARRANVDFFARDAQCPHQLQGVLVGRSARGEARHGVGENIGAGEIEPIHRPCRDDQRLRRIKSAGDADHRLVESGRVQTLHQPVHLDVVDLAAAFVPACRIRRDIGKAVDAPLEGHVARRHLELEGDAAHGSDAVAVKRGAVVEARHAHAVLAQTLQIDIGGDYLRTVQEALRLGETLAILVDQTLSVPGEVGRGLTKASRRIDIGGDALGRLARTEHAAGSRPCQW